MKNLSFLLCLLFAKLYEFNVELTKITNEWRKNMAKNIITMNRGDTYEFSLTIDDEGSESGKYILQGNDTVYFGLMEPNSIFEHSLVRKSTKDDIKFDEEGNFFITIEPEDTEYLLPGVYYYSVKLEMDHELGKTLESVHKVVTVINKTKFIILD